MTAKARATEKTKKAVRGSLGGDVFSRVEAEVSGALKRRGAQEERLAGVLRALAPHGADVRRLLADAGMTLAKRKAFDRPLYQAAVRSLAETGDARAVPLLAASLPEDMCGLAPLSAAAFVTEKSLAPALARVAGSRHAHLALAAEVARVARGESSGATLGAIAPKIKEAHRISLCVEVFLPLLRGPLLSPLVGPALTVLRDSERHLGRWLVLGEVSARGGDGAPLTDALGRAETGPASAKVAWALVAWALRGQSAPPTERPSLDLITRLSDRPSASRDMTFLFRLADARAPHAKPLLESLLKEGTLVDEIAVRAALYLARDHHRDALRAELIAAARSKKDSIRGLAAAALFDLGEREAAAETATDAMTSRSIGTFGWGALVSGALAGQIEGPMVTEAMWRRLSAGWLE